MKLSAHFLVKGQDYRKVYIFRDIVAANVSEVDTHEKEYPNWKRLNGKKKKAIARLVLKEVFEAYDFNQEIEASLEELAGIEEQLPASGIMNLEEMARFIDDLNSSTLINLSSNKRSSLYIQDEELRFIDELLDNRIINRLLSYDGYSP
jgi:hypothetical protein